MRLGLQVKHTHHSRFTNGDGGRHTQRSRLGRLQSTQHPVRVKFPSLYSENIIKSLQRQRDPTLRATVQSQSRSNCYGLLCEQNQGTSSQRGSSLSVGMFYAISSITVSNTVMLPKTRFNTPTSRKTSSTNRGTSNKIMFIFTNERSCAQCSVSAPQRWHHIFAMPHFKKHLVI
jgi:hypothetical protein